MINLINQNNSFHKKQNINNTAQMYQSFLLPPTRKPFRDSTPNQNNKIIQKNELPCLSKYQENKGIKQIFQKDQERRKSLQQQSNQTEDQLQNKLLIQQQINKRERDLFAGQKKSLYFDVPGINPINNLYQPYYHLSQFSSIKQNQVNCLNQDESSFRQRSTTINSKIHEYSPTQKKEKEIPMISENIMLSCNQVLDFKISIDSQIQIQQQEKKQHKQIPNYINFFKNRFEHPYQVAKQQFYKQLQIKSKFKNWGFIFIFIFRLIKLIRYNKIRKIQNLKDLKTRLQQSDQQQSKELQLDWYKKLMQTVLQTIKQSGFYQNFKQNQNPNDKQFMQNRKYWMINLTLLFFQNLVDMTKAEFLNQEILAQAQNHILQISKKGSLFVAKRIKTRLSRIEQTLIICDYIFFSLIIQEIIQDSNHLLCITEHHLAECKFQLVSICSLIQILFMNYFKEMQLYQPKILKIVQKRLNISGNNQQLQVIEDDDIEQNEIIISNLNSYEFYEKLIKENQKWFQDISTFFRICVQNLSSQNNI